MRNVKINHLILIAYLFMLCACSDDLTKNEEAGKFPRIEFSSCTACYECLEDFSCPQAAIRVNEVTGKVYIDQNRCIKCYDCLNAFECEYDAITRKADLIAPASPQNLEVVSDSIGEIEISFIAPGDDSLSGIAYLYEFQIKSSEGQFIETGFTPPLPRYSGVQETWRISGLPEHDTLEVQIKAMDEVGLRSAIAEQRVEVMGEYIDIEAPLAITDLAAISEEYSISLSWTAPADPDPRAVVDSYIIRCHNQEISMANWDAAEQVDQTIQPQSPGNIEELIIDYALPSGYLYFAIKSTDAAGNISELSNNAAGEATTDITAPAEISDLMAGDAGNTTVPLTWTATGDNGNSGTAHHYEIRYAESELTPETWFSAIIFEQGMQPQPAGSVENLSITGLLPETEYFFAIIAYDEVDNFSELSNIAGAITESTPDIEPPAAIDDLSAEADDQVIFLNWTATGDDGNTGTAAQYQLHYHIEVITAENLSAAQEITGLPYPSAAGQAEEYTVDFLAAGTEWFFVITASDEAENNSELSNNASAMIAVDETPPAAVTDLAAQVTESIVQLTWTAPGDDGMEGTASIYDLRKSLQPLTEQNWFTAVSIPAPEPSYAGMPETFQIDDLEYNTIWYFAIKATDEMDNTSAISNNCEAIIEMEIDEIAPSAITDISVLEGQSSYINRITINWTAPGDDGDEGTCTAYEIRYSTVMIDETNWNTAQIFSNPPVPEAAGSSQSCQITGLNAGIVYYFAIRGIDEAENMGEISNTPGGKIVYQINAGQCHDCNQCIWRCDQEAIFDAGAYKVIDPDLCIACGECLVCPYGAIHLWVIEY